MDLIIMQIYFIPSTVVLASSIGIYFFSLYPKGILKTLENDHYQYEQISNKLSNLEASKKGLKAIWGILKITFINQLHHTYLLFICRILFQKGLG